MHPKSPSTDKWIYSEILLSHKKEQNWVIYNSNVEGHRVCHTERSKSGIERQILSTNA